MGMMCHISFIASRISGIDLHVLLGMCVLLCEHDIACALKWRVALVVFYSIGLEWDPLSGCAGRPSSETKNMKETGCGFGHILYFIWSTLMTCIYFCIKEL